MKEATDAAARALLLEVEPLDALDSLIAREG
jgi:hypothetical protein